MRNLPLAIISFTLAFLLSFTVTGLYLKAKNKPRPWPGKTLTIENRAGKTEEVRGAIDKINQTGIGIKLRLVEDNGQVVVKAVAPRDVDRRCDDNDCVGHASSIGYRGRREEIVIDKKYLAEHRVEVIMIHELGHILGLEHTKQNCRMMNGKSILLGCASDLGWQRCGFQRAEVNRLADLYRRQGSYSPWCRLAGIGDSRPPSIIDHRGVEIKQRRSQYNWEEVVANCQVNKENLHAYQGCPQLNRRFNR